MEDICITEPTPPSLLMVETVIWTLVMSAGIATSNTSPPDTIPSKRVSELAKNCTYTENGLLVLKSRQEKVLCVLVPEHLDEGT